MSTTVTYKGSTLTTVNNQTRTLKTAGKYMEGDVILTDVTEGGSGGYVWQDENGYVHLDDEGTTPSGDSNLVFLGADEVTVSTTSTSATTEKTCSIPLDSTINGEGLYLCLITDKAGARNGYFYSSVGCIYRNTTLRTWSVRITSNGAKGTIGSGYGVYATSMSVSSTDGVYTLKATISSRYNSTYSLTVDGIYSIKFYCIDIDSLILGE